MRPATFWSAWHGLTDSMSSTVLQYEAKALGDLLRRGHPNADKKVGVVASLMLWPEGIVRLPPLPLAPKSRSLYHIDWGRPGWLPGARVQRGRCARLLRRAKGRYRRGLLLPQVLRGAVHRRGARPQPAQEVRGRRRRRWWTLWGWRQGRARRQGAGRTEGEGARRRRPQVNHLGAS